MKTNGRMLARRYHEDILGGKWNNFFNWKPYFMYYGYEIPYCTEETVEQASTAPKACFIPTAEALSDEGFRIYCENECEVPLWMEALTPVRNFSKAPEDNVFCHVNAGADDFDKAYDKEESHITVAQGLGFSDGVLVLPFDTPSYDVEGAPYVEYDVTLSDEDRTIEVRTLPTLHVYENREARYAIQIGDTAPRIFSIHTSDFSSEWRYNVLHGYSSRSVSIPSGCSGNQKIRIWLLDPGIVLQEILIR